MRFCVGQIVLDRARPTPKAAAIVVGISKHPEIRICRWRGKQQSTSQPTKSHWSLPASVDEDQLELVVDWTQMPLTEAKRLAAAAFERGYLARAMESAKGSVTDAARLAGVDRSNFRRLLQRHGLAKMPRSKRQKKTKKTKKKKRRSR